MCVSVNIGVCVLKVGVMHVLEQDFLMCQNVCMCFHLLSLTHAVLFGCQSQLPSLSRILQYNEIYFVSVSPFRKQTYFHYATTKT